MCQVTNAKSSDHCGCSWFDPDSSSLERCAWAAAKQMDCPDFQWQVSSTWKVDGPCSSCSKGPAKEKRGGVFKNLLKLSGARK
ncbi:hypothetical protein GGTG_00905 [Gaeumannomyces tritici R3-111a-1]|uniref:Uncharacterized protein n=1 Tax=Gaeumannomyces tritici (strain R3-111a-1) TaxID=644352 RepID=J3NI20_GAET3|nr:hypothetical protein GGTG_00905 [Gaeumannomyces tritici R3-111a-1]EJT80913.1 hypothetical protein GGTG_00905 [Gaeumannomyces tritici R3-111a-1]